MVISGARHLPYKIIMGSVAMYWQDLPLSDTSKSDDEGEYYECPFILPYMSTLSEKPVTTERDFRTSPEGSYLN